MVRLESSEKTIAILGDRWWSQTAKPEGNRMGKQVLCHIWKMRNERPNVGGVSIRSRNGAPSRKGCVVNGQMVKTSRKLVHLSPPPRQLSLPLLTVRILTPPPPHALFQISSNWNLPWTVDLLLWPAFLLETLLKWSVTWMDVQPTTA